MDLTVLGANGTHPTPASACSGYLLRHDGHAVWMDAGNGTLARLQSYVDPLTLDALVLSHAHPDHCADVYPFFYMLLMDSRRAPMPVFTPPGVRRKLEGLIGEDSIAKFDSLFDWHELSPGDTVETGPIRLEAFDAAHSTANLTVRASAGGRAFCYSGDTGPNEHLARAAADANVFLCEASWLESDIGLMEPIHLTAREAGAAARDAGAARLVLTHLWPRNDVAMVREQAAEGFGGNIELAIETERITI